MDPIQQIAENLHYTLTRKIAEGGMGVVYEAEQFGTDDFVKSVAIKLIVKEYSKIKEFRSNFIGEAKLVADLIHTNIVQTYHLGQIDSNYFMVMEFVSGVNFDQFLMKHLLIKQFVPIDLSVFLVSRICRGLAYAHAKKDKSGKKLGIVHRDISPRNVMISYEGDVKITDFGIAKAKDLMYNKEGEVIAGKDEYLSPEQALKKITDHRADIFSCGVILAELLLGYNVYEDATPEKTRDNIVSAKLPDFTQQRKEICPKLNAILHKSMAKNPDQRYQTAYDLLTDLELYLYSDGYGPTNEKLALYMHELFNKGDSAATQHWKENTKKGLTHLGLIQ